MCRIYQLHGVGDILVRCRDFNGRSVDKCEFINGARLLFRKQDIPLTWKNNEW